MGSFNHILACLSPNKVINVLGNKYCLLLMNKITAMFQHLREFLLISSAQLNSALLDGDNPYCYFLQPPTHP